MNTEHKLKIMKEQLKLILKGLKKVKKDFR